MQTSRLAPSVVFAILTLVAPARLRAACTRDAECAPDRVCVKGQCVSPVDPDSGSGPGSLGAANRRGKACIQKCDQGNTKCLSRVQSYTTCLSKHRTACIDACKKTGEKPTTCGKRCSEPGQRLAWEPECSKQGDPARQECYKRHESCLKACDVAS